MADIAVIQDSFADTNGTAISVHTPTGVGGVWYNQTNTGQIQSNMFVTLTGTHNLIRNDTSVPPGETRTWYIQGKFNFYGAATNRRIEFKIGTASIELSSTFDEIYYSSGPATAHVIIDGALYRLELDYTGNTYTLYENGVSIKTGAMLADGGDVKIDCYEHAGVSDFEVGYIFIGPPDAPSGLTATCQDPVIPSTTFVADVLSGDAPLTVNFTDTSNSSPTSWLWDFGDGTTSTSQNPTHIYTSPGVYIVTLKSTNALGTTYYQLLIVVTGATVTDGVSVPETPPADTYDQEIKCIRRKASRTFFLDKANSKVLIYDNEGNYLGFAGGYGSGAGNLDHPSSMDVN